MNEPKVETHFEVVKLASQNKFNYEVFNQNCVHFYNLHKSSYDTKKSSAEMQSETITLCEINASLWVKALNSEINNLTKNTYSHYIIVQKFINYLLNTESYENIGLIENFFWKLLITHPPSSEMFDYYWRIIFDKFICLNGKEAENENLFFCLMERITDCLKVKMNSDGNTDLNGCTLKSDKSAKNKTNFTGFHSQSTCLDIKESLNISSKSLDSKASQIYFDKLPWKEKIDRSLIVLNFLYNILETDFIFWLDSKEFKPPTDNSRPLISYLLWKNQRDVGSLSKEIQKVLQLYESAMTLDFQNLYVIEKFVVLIGEVIRWSDSSQEIKYPFVGPNSANFIRELSLILNQRVVEMKNNLNENELIVNFKPPWVRLFLCSNLLSLIIGHQCISELSAVYDILEHIIHMENKDLNIKNSVFKSFDTTKRKKLIKQKREEFKNINARFKNGKTHLHLACENNDVEKIKMLLTFHELDINAVDRKGWTALHIAADNGKTASVQQLLLFQPEPGGSQKFANTRAKGPENKTPLMCAASQGHAEICKLLLEHSGSILLEDVDEFNQTALELAHASKVKRILKYYKTNNKKTENNLNNINFDMNLKKVVLKLCVEMIQAYFSTYKTSHIWKTLKQSGKTVQENQTTDDKFNWDYNRYYKDVRINIHKLKSLLPKLQSIEEFKSLGYIYKMIFLLYETT